MKVIHKPPITTCVALLFATVLLLASCETYHFENPLPSDAKNIYEFPKEFRGIWLVKDGILTIGKNFFEISSRDTGRIVNGIWNFPRDTGRVEHLRRVVFDSLGRPWDTISNYIIKANRIYPLGDNKLEKGQPFLIKGDTIYYISETFRTELNSNIFLRRISDTYYIFNMREGEAFEMQDHWWQIALMNKDDNGTIVISDLKNTKGKSGSRTELLGKQHLIEALSNDYYYSGNLNKKDIQKMIRDSVFTDHFIKLKESMRIRQK